MTMASVVAPRVAAGDANLMIVENLPVPRSPGLGGAQSLRRAGSRVSVICPVVRSQRVRFELIDSSKSTATRYPSRQGQGRLHRRIQQRAFWESPTRSKCFGGRGFDAIHACNPPDLIFLMGPSISTCSARVRVRSSRSEPELFEAKIRASRADLEDVVLLER